MIRQPFYCETGAFNNFSVEKIDECGVEGHKNSKIKQAIICVPCLL